MPYFLTPTVLAKDTIFKPDDQEIHRLLNVFRIRLGEKLIFQDPQNKRWLCQVEKIQKNQITLLVLNSEPAPKESPLKLTLAMALISEQALDFTLVKATELGIYKIIIFPADQSPYALKNKWTQKTARWQKIILEATRQCMRVVSPQITTLSGLSELLNYTSDYNLRLALDFQGSSFKEHNIKPMETVLIIGPEGGFSPTERQILQDSQNLSIYTLGTRVLRAETAAIAGITLLEYLYGDLK